MKRKMEETRTKNNAKALALKEYYESDAYKLAIAQAEHTKVKEAKTANPTMNWLKKASQNAVRQLNEEHTNTSAEKLKELLKQK